MAARELSRQQQSGLRLRGVPVFLYHGLTAPGERASGERDTKYWVHGSIFREHLNLITREGFRAALLGELWNRPDVSVGARSPVIITFDDGLASDYEIAYPALRAAAVRAEFFVNTATIGRPGFLSWPRVIEMHRAGLSFQSHSHDHVALLGLPVRALEHQLRHSKRVLEDRLGSGVDFLAVPYGLLNRRIVQTALHVGYRAVCSSRHWTARPGARTVNRVAIYRDTSLLDFLRFLHGHPLPFTRRLARTALTYIPKRFLLRLRPARIGVHMPETGT